MNMYEGGTAVQRSQVFLASRLDSVDEALSHLNAMLQRHDYSTAESFGVRLALLEAVVNAIRHGNALDSTKVVRVSIRVSQVEVWIRVEDEGGGFRPEGVPDPTLPENIDRPHGRGLLLMRHFMTKVEYNQTGNCVTLLKLRDLGASTAGDCGSPMSNLVNSPVNTASLRPDLDRVLECTTIS